MFKTIALYKDIEDAEAFEAFYVNEFIPKMLSLPGVVKLKVNRLLPAPFGERGGQEESYFLLCETYYESAEAMQKVIQSPEGLEAASMIMEKASKFMTVYVGKEEVYSKSSPSVSSAG
ncbi:EthD family reductase [Lihuaxuella thermophila]|uniref:EthD domain-containing protein n=1 Tax=Lihuaxuella thermophila TaxID=1173111 RepID=A0A1H8FRG4_9BACL|nr:EthD family reductase [Lihuaxuella thermophila]SEN34150.1 conserved hypothetical protein [Lihuaxuella thermophila]